MTGARPDPTSEWIGQLDADLRRTCPDVYGGLLVADDGHVELRAIRNTAVLEHVLEKAASRKPRGATGVRVITGMRNSIGELEEAWALISRSRQELAARGLTVTQWGIDARANRVRVGVIGLTDSAILALQRDFDRELIEFVDSGNWTI